MTAPRPLSPAVVRAVRAYQRELSDAIRALSTNDLSRSSVCVFTTGLALRALEKALLAEAPARKGKR